MSETQSSARPEPIPSTIPAFTVLPAGTTPPATIPSTSPTASGPAPMLNPRSCVTCRRRKVRCDKHMPCSNCRRAHIQCVFPAPGRAPRRPRPRDPDAPPKNSSEREAELMKRLRKLEGIVEELSGQIDVDARQPSPSAGSSPVAETSGLGPGPGPGPERADRTASTSVSSPSGGSKDSPMGGMSASAPRSMAGTEETEHKQKEVYKQFGRLVVTSKGKDRYISSAFWSKVNDELDELRTSVHSLSDNTDYSADEATPETTPQVPENDHDSFLFGYKSSSLDLSAFHPLPSQIPYMWQIYCENIEPVLKMVHVPSLERIMRGLRGGNKDLSPSDEALVFSIYFAALTSLEDDEVEANFGSPKAPLLDRYRFAVEQSLARANFLKNPDLTVLAALILFLVVVRRHDDTRFCWTATGLAIRIAQGLGLHRDGTHLKLSPFETEMRRRLWWALCGLDLRCAEEMGTDVTIFERTFDTEFPSNINDDEISPESAEIPPSREGASDCALSLVRHEICAMCRRLVALATANGSVCPKDAASSMSEREHMLVEVYERIETKFLKSQVIDADPLFLMAAMVARIVMAKMSLVIYQPMLFPGADRELSAEIKERLFISAVEIVEYNYKLNVAPEFKRFRWLFQTYTQWHAIAYLMLEMSKRPWSATLERAWENLNGTLHNRHVLDLTKTADHLAVWLPLGKLLLKARRHRTAEIARLKADPEAARRLDMEDRMNSSRSRFGPAPGSEKDVLEVRERWLALVSPDGGGAVPQATASESSGLQRATSSPGASYEASLRPQMRVSGQDMEYFNELMGGPFNPMTLYGALTSDTSSAEAAVQMLLSGKKPESASASHEPGAASQPTGAAAEALRQQGMHLEQAATATATSRKDENPPPWLWSDPFTVLTTKLDEGGEPADVNMDLDEEFNWQSWQETVKGLEMGSTGTVTGTTTTPWNP